MSKTLSKLFPFFDHLYIYQILEYDSLGFIKWFIKNPFKRDLQKKHKLIWTNKAKLLAFVSLFLIVLHSVAVSYHLFNNLLLAPLVLIAVAISSPLFLVVGRVLILPLEYYEKKKIVSAAENKLRGLKDLRVVAITGSFGKTSIKDILYTLLWKKYYVVKTPKSFNTPLGIARTILEDVKDSTQILIVEVGAYRRGEIKQIAGLIKPQIGVITAIAPQHLERFGSLESIANAKFELPQSLTGDGVAILNSEYDWVKKLAPTVRSKIVLYGNQSDQFWASDIKTGKDGTTFNLHTPRGSARISTPLIGEHHAVNFVAATAIAMQLGLTLTEVKERAKLLLPTPHRLEIRKRENITFIDNTYNTNPSAARASLKLLSEYPSSYKIIITPGLVELGEEFARENRDLAKDAAKIVDEFIIVGENAKKDLLEGLNETNFSKSKVHFVRSTQAGINLLSRTAKSNSVVLLENDLPDQYF